MRIVSYLYDDKCLSDCITQQTVDNNEFDDVSASQVLEDEEMQVGNYTKTRTEKDILIAKLLCRYVYYDLGESLQVVVRPP